jgi:hypothetical protein
VKAIVLDPGAAKSLDTRPDDANARNSDAPYAHAIDSTGDCKAMAGTPTVRLGVGDDRVIFDETATTTAVLALGHRKDIYR